MINFIWIYLFSQGLLCFISYSDHLSVIYNNKNYGSFPYIIFIAVQNIGITLDRPQCIAICSKFKMASVLLKNSIRDIGGAIAHNDSYITRRLQRRSLRLPTRRVWWKTRICGYEGMRICGYVELV